MSGPSTIYIIRHGEKPGKGDIPPGFDWLGNGNCDSLTAQGWRRAASLAVLFGGDPIAGSMRTRGEVQMPQKLIAPLYTQKAAPPAGSDGGDGSASEKVDDSDEHRAFQTIEPLCQLLNIGSLAGGGQPITIDATYTIAEHAAVAQQIQNAGVDTVLVAWEHNNIPGIASLLTGSPIGEWPSNRFDLILKFTPTGSGAYSMVVLGQYLLSTDSDPPPAFPAPTNGTGGTGGR